MEDKKTALIIEGGGQRGVFSFGITDTFINRLNSLQKEKEVEILDK